MTRGTSILVAVVIVLVLVALVGLVGFLWYVGQWNHVAKLEETVKEKWGNVDTALQRRLDLVPNLVNTVKGYASHERELFENIANARKAYFQPESTVEAKMASANRMSGLLSRLLLLQERYPELKANESFVTLQSQLEGTENRIKFERDNYNAAVRELNSYVRSFFGAYFAGKREIKTYPYFEAPEEAKTAPEVDFGGDKKD